jgi:cation transport ATPase
MACRFDIVNLSIETIKSDIDSMKRMAPIASYSGIVISIVGIIVVILNQIIHINLDGYAVIGFGISLLLFSLAIKQTLTNDSDKFSLLVKVARIERNLNAYRQRDSPSEKLRTYDQYRKSLYAAVILLIIGMALSILSLIEGFLWNDPIWMELLTIGFAFLMAATVFEQSFIDAYINSRIDERLDWVERSSQELSGPV